MAALRPWVTDVRVFGAVPSSSAVLTRLPSVTPALVVSAADDGRMTVRAVGPSTRAFHKAAPQVPRHARITLRVGGGPALLGARLHELANRAVPIDELRGLTGEELSARLAPLNGDLLAATHFIERALLMRLGGGPIRGSALVRRVALLLDAGDASEQHIHGLSRALGVSGRQLRQVFRDQAGISPKRYARITRIRRVAQRTAGSRERSAPSTETTAARGSTTPNLTQQTGSRSHLSTTSLTPCSATTAV
jgi:AraC-like DNA-binding protein